MVTGIHDEAEHSGSFSTTMVIVGQTASSMEHVRQNGR